MSHLRAADVTRAARRASVAALALLAAAAVARADVFVLAGGDRISGKVLSRAGKTWSIQTPYGRLAIPRAKIDKIVHDDGSEEVLNPLATPTPEPPAVHLILVITGKTFWYAWDPQKAEVPDATLRLDVSLDEDDLVVYSDPHLDPQDIPGATVNSFSFAAEDVVAAPAKGVQVPAPEARPGRIVLRVDLPPDRAGHHRLRLAYQVNDGTTAAPAWRDASAATVGVDLKVEAPNFVQIQQDAGKMEFSGFGRRKMKNVDTFRLLPREAAE